MAAYRQIQSIMQTSTPFAHAGGGLHSISARMSSITRHGADTKVSVSSLPSDVLQRICSFLEDPDDLASCHLVDTRYTCACAMVCNAGNASPPCNLLTWSCMHPCISLLVQADNMSYIYLRSKCLMARCRFCAAARATLTSAEPQHPSFLKMALQHHYPLRHLNTAELPFCRLDSYLSKVQCRLEIMTHPPFQGRMRLVGCAQYIQGHDARPLFDCLQSMCFGNCSDNKAWCGMSILEQAPSSLTSLEVAEQTLKQQAEGSEAPCTLSMAKVLQGISSLRSLSWPVRTTTATFLCRLHDSCVCCIHGRGTEIPGWMMTVRS